MFNKKETVSLKRKLTKSFHFYIIFICNCKVEKITISTENSTDHRHDFFDKPLPASVHW